MISETDQELTERIARNEAEREAERAEWARWAATEPSGEYRDGFIAGYLRAYADGHEYACSVEWAELGFGQFLSEGGRSLPIKDVDPWE